MGVHRNHDKSIEKINLLIFLHSMKIFLYNKIVISQRSNEVARSVFTFKQNWKKITNTTHQQCV